MTDGKHLGTRLEGGAVLPDAARQLADQLSLSFCDVSGFGSLEWIEIALDDEGTAIQRFEGAAQLLSLSGRLRTAGTMTLGDFYCTFSRGTDNGIQVLGGRLHRAQVIFAELTVTPLTALEASKASGTGTDSPATEAPTRQQKAVAPVSPPARQAQSPALRTEREAPRPAPAEVNRAPAALDNRWAKAVMESKRIEADPTVFDEEETESRPKRGDSVLHAQFGECQVSRIDDDHITLRKPDGRNVQLGLTVLRFFRVSEQKGKSTFRVEIGKR